MIVLMMVVLMGHGALRRFVVTSWL
jgi:hypothetical protein